MDPLAVLVVDDELPLREELSYLLSPDDRAWLDDYHAQVRTALGPLLDGADLAWLERHCAPL